MFEAKKTSLLPSGSSSTTTSAFVKAGLKKSAETLSGNAALKYSTTGNAFVDQFGVIGSYRKPRKFEEITKDSELLWAINQRLTVIFILYLRMITRVTSLFDGTKTKIAQKGAEMKHEGIFRMIWLHVKQPVSFWKNIGLFVSVGSWKDIITMLQYDLVYNGWKERVLDWEKFGKLILTGLENPVTNQLIKKYLPQLKSNNQCKTVEAQADNMIAKWICSLLFGTKDDSSGWTYKKYRKLKSSGTAHQWQQLISQRQFDRIDFNTIHGRALSLLVRGKFLANHNLTEKYKAWITKPETKEVKYTGFVHELFQPCQNYGRLVFIPVHEQETINKQFATLVSKAGEKKQTNFIVVRDTSHSMSSTATGSKMSCYNIAKALALYFSEFLTGFFSNAWIEFNSDAKMHTWNGNTPLEKWYNDHSRYIGSTNFLSVVKLFTKIKKTGVSESDFPTGILCISDGEFNPAGLSKTNVDAAREILLNGGFSEEYARNFVIVLWNLQSGYYGRNTGKKFETYGDVPNVFYFSGYSASVVSFLTSEIKTAADLFNEAMNQEILQMVEL